MHRLHQPLGHHRHQCTRDDEHRDRFPHAPSLFRRHRLPDGAEDVAMCLEREYQSEDVGDEKNDGGADRNLMNQLGTVGLNGCAKKDRGDQHRAQRQDQLSGL